jgi:hypothetical protein
LNSPAKATTRQVELMAKNQNSLEPKSIKVILVVALDEGI